MAGGSHAPGQAGDPPNHRKRKAPVPTAAAGDEAEAEAEAHALGREVEELEEGLADLDRRVLEHLRSTATRLADAAVDRLAALRPPACQEFPAVSETSSSEDQEQLHKKLNILKSKIEANIADLPKVLEKMHESVARCKNLENLDVKIHPIFQTRCLYHV
ncbi:uncharacterized protein LOC120641407 [Panicum virgatum]|uniref:Uncharacterized protein n=1 Tax=Panicum virgatum TaxID=38727 RepID=A0A8T0QJS1_PANVG|nr:uncharacterized protein LOC120641407 [Panicum virgatum]KAG2573923.1 hypothetical protein PVAP13_7KG285940 [Panicum virgatum]